MDTIMYVFMIWVCTVCICHFMRNFGVQNLGYLPYTAAISYDRFTIRSSLSDLLNIDS